MRGVEHHPRLDDDRQPHPDRLQQQDRRKDRRRDVADPGIRPTMASRPKRMSVPGTAELAVEQHGVPAQRVERLGRSAVTAI